MIKCAATFLLLFQLHFVNFSEQQYNNVPASPCPSIFEYRSDGYQWFGVIHVNSPRLEQRDVLLQVTLSLQASTSVSALARHSFLLPVFGFRTHASQEYGMGMRYRIAS